MTRTLLTLLYALCLLAVLSPAGAGNDAVHDVLRLWGSQGGPWQGHIDIYGPDSAEPETVRLTTRWDAVSDHSIVTKIETFTAPTAENSAVTVMLADIDDETIVTPYFANGRQRDYRFSVDSVAVTDETHWTTIIATPGTEEIYEDRPARLRYVRTRDGDTIENTKEVRFLDGDGDGAWELRSFIRQTLAR
jgi:hypothetical protein